MANIKQSYLNPNFKGSLSGAVRFYKNRKPKLSYKQVQNELLKLKEYYQFVPARKKFPRRKTVSSFPNLMFCSDLIILPPKYFKDNKPFKYIIVFVDIYSKRLFAYPLSSKKPASIIRAMKLWLKQVKKKPSYLQTDRGKLPRHID